MADKKTKGKKKTKEMKKMAKERAKETKKQAKEKEKLEEQKPTVWGIPVDEGPKTGPKFDVAGVPVEFQNKGSCCCVIIVLILVIFVIFGMLVGGPTY